MNAIMYSVNPKPLCNILNKKKTVEVRTTIPAEWKEWLKDQSKPFPKKELYLYCTKGKELNFNAYENQWEYNHPLDKKLLNPSIHNVNGKVVAKCVVEKIEKVTWERHEWLPKDYYAYNISFSDLCNACLSVGEFNDYGKKKPLYALHLTALEIFDKPKELGEFHKKWFNKVRDQVWKIPFPEEQFRIKHSPQSWCYIESEEK